MPFCNCCKLWQLGHFPINLSNLTDGRAQCRKTTVQHDKTGVGPFLAMYKTHCFVKRVRSLEIRIFCDQTIYFQFLCIYSTRLGFLTPIGQFKWKLQQYTEADQTQIRRPCQQQLQCFHYCWDR